jgi:hypothetical protein
MKRGLGAFILIFGVFLFSINFIVADDLDDCVNKCKVNFEEETDRISCIIECKELFYIDGIEKSSLKCLNCGDSCVPADQIATMICLPSTNGKPQCGVKNNECVVLGFEDEEEFMANWDGTCGDIDCDEIEIIKPGITPDSFLF